jgi:RHS repeat-associated protein
MMTNSAGATVWKANYEPFGSATVNEDPDGNGIKVTNNLGLPGQYFDAETGLYYNMARYYDPRIGRYISSDPIGLAGGLNPYLYARANPLRYIDPSGLIGWGGDPFMDDYSTSDLQQMNVPYLWLFAPGGNGNVWNSGFTQQDNVCSSIAAPLNSNKCTQQCCVEHDACYTHNLCNASSWIGNAPGVNVNFACQQCNAAAAQCVKRNLVKKECENGCQSK